MPPILFAGLSILLASIFLFIHTAITSSLRDIFNRKALPYIVAVTFLIIIIPSIFIFTGTKMTSGVNTTILLQTEVFFTFIFVALFFRENITLRRIIGALIIVIGTTIILYNGTFYLNWGDLLIILGVMFFPFGNMAAKKALAIVPSNVILLLRSFFGGIVLIIFSILVEDSAAEILPAVQNHIFYIAVNGIVIMYISKVLWYEGLKRIDISKAIPIAMSFPAFSLLFLYIFINEVPSVYQWIGIALTMLGVGFLTYKEAPSLLSWVGSLFRKKEETPPFT
jgi:O-acetylserine/cysteine efflux transporter